MGVVYGEPVRLPRPRPLVLLAVALVAGLALAAGLVWATHDGSAGYDHALQKYGDERGEANRYVNLPDGDAQLAYGSPDGHRLVVQWRDPDGHGWTAPKTLYDNGRLTAIDSVIRHAAGTVAIVETYTPDTSSDQDDDDVTVVMVCRERTCTPGETGPGYTSDEPQLTPDGGVVYLGQTPRAALVWTRDDGFDAWPWSGLPPADRSATSEVLVSPDGSIRMVTGTPSRGACTYALRVSSPGDADLVEVARTTERAPVDDCGTYLDGPGSDRVRVHPDDPRGAAFWFVRDGDDWSTTRTDPSAQS